MYRRSILSKRTAHYGALGGRFYALRSIIGKEASMLERAVERLKEISERIEKLRGHL